MLYPGKGERFTNDTILSLLGVSHQTFVKRRGGTVGM